MTSPYISDLDPTVPVNTDNAGGGNEELQNLKLSIQNTFPNVDGGANSGQLNGGVQSTTDQINSWESRITTLEGAPSFSFPIGMIIMWSDTPGLPIPTGWAICDGTVQNGTLTPNLIGRFPYGATVFAPVDTQGGELDLTYDITGGDHTHTPTIAGHTLLESEIPNHSHTVSASPASEGAGSGNTVYEPGGAGITTGSTGGGGPHTHAGSTNSTESHTHSALIQPPFHSLYFIMYVGT